MLRRGWSESFDKTTGGLWSWVFVGSMFTAGATLAFLARAHRGARERGQEERIPEVRVAPILGRDIKGLYVSVAF